MKPSEMTNEELASFLEDVTWGEQKVDDSFVREAAARLRNVTIRSDNSAVIAELRRRLKVAEDALVACRDGMCGECHRQHPGETCICSNWCYEMSMTRTALAAIRKEGGNDGK